MRKTLCTLMRKTLCTLMLLAAGALPLAAAAAAAAAAADAMLGSMPLDVCGLFLDGQQLTQLDFTRQVPASVVPGVGDLSEAAYFYIDGANVYHLMGCDENSLVPGSYPPAYTRYLHSYSGDGGKTWQGPSAVFDCEGPISRVAFAAGPDQVLHLMADSSSLLVATLTPDDFAAGAPEAHFGAEQMDEYTWDLPYEERLRYSFIDCQSVLLDGEGGLHYMANGFWDMTRLGGDAWAVRDMEKPAEWSELATIFLRRDGSFALLAKETGSMEPLLYFAEMPAGR